MKAVLTTSFTYCQHPRESHRCPSLAVSSCIGWLATLHDSCEPGRALVHPGPTIKVSLLSTDPAGPGPFSCHILPLCISTQSPCLKKQKLKKLTSIFLSAPTPQLCICSSPKLQTTKLEMRLQNPLLFEV